MTEEDISLLMTVKMKCKEDSSFLSHVINAGTSGVMAAEEEMRCIAADMETVASAMCFLAGQSRVSPQLKKQISDLALSKLSKHQGNFSINWSHEIVTDKNK